MAKKFNLKSFLISTLRRASYKVPMRTECLKAAKVGYNQYRCAECGESKIYGRKDTRVDHINPVRPIATSWDWNMFINNLFCEASGLQVLCQAHHDVKTQMENSLRRQYKKELTLSKSHATINKKKKKGKKK